MDDANHITEKIQAEKEPEDLNIYDIGTRQLNDEQIENLRLALEPILKFVEPNNSYTDALTSKITELLLKEDIAFECGLNIYAHLHWDIKILRETYTKGPANDDIQLRDLLKIAFNEDERDKESKKLEKEIIDIIERKNHEGAIIGAMGTNINCVIDPVRKQTLFERITYNRKGEPQSDMIEVVNASLKKLIVYDTPISEEPRKWKSVWESRGKKPLFIGPCFLDETIKYLTDNGNIMSRRYAADIISKAMNTFSDEGLAEIKTDIENPGFYFNNKTNELMVVKYDIKEPSTKELKLALETLEDLIKWYPGHEEKLITIFKWGLISPFHFAMKQRGADVQWGFLYGRGGSGKSTMGKMVLYLWGEPKNEVNYISGSGFNSEYRIGEKLSQSTFPLVVDEPGAIFEKINTRDMIKTAVQQTICRGKSVNGRYQNIPAYSSVVITSNQPFPSKGDDQEALFRRFVSESFGYSEKKTNAKLNAFNQEFNIKNTDKCKLHDLKPFAQFVTNEIVNDPELLDMGWKKLADTMILRICMDLGIDVPEWLQGWTEDESLDEFNDIQLERIRAFLQKQINDAYGRIQILDEDGKPKEYFEETSSSIKTTRDFKQRVRVVLNERKIEWAWLNQKDDVVLTYGFIEALHKGTCIKDSMKNLAELLDWNHGASKDQNRKSIKVITVSRAKFTEFVYPTCEFEGCGV